VPTAAALLFALGVGTLVGEATGQAESRDFATALVRTPFRKIRMRVLRCAPVVHSGATVRVA